MTQHIERILDLHFHTNGNEGTPFHVILFEDTGEQSSRKVAIVFGHDHHVAVLDVSKLFFGNISFGRNSWRGDVFEPELRDAIDDYDTACSEAFYTNTRDGAML